MFYLSKTLYTIINNLRHGETIQPAKIQPSGLSFAVDLDGNRQNVEEWSGMVQKAVQKNGNAYSYVVGSGMGRVSASEQINAELAKGRVMELLARSEEEISLGMFNAARDASLAELLPKMSNERARFLSYFIAHDTVGYGPISILLEDKGRIEEIEINSPREPISIFHADYGRCTTNLRFVSEGAFRHNINKFVYDADKELGEDSPIIDAQVENARIHAQIKPYALSGAAASIRLANSKLVSFDYLIRKGTTNFEALAYLWLALDTGMNIVIAGPPASGKTTMMSALFTFIPKVERIITVEEDVNELRIKLDINNSVGLYGSRYGNGTNTREQVINSLRMRPDRLVVGEIRGGEARELFAGANLGIPFVTTMHSNEGGLEIVKKLIVKPMNVETRSLSSLDLAVYMRQTDLSKRLLSGVYEYKWLSRAETERADVTIEQSEAVDIAEAVSGGKLAREILPHSKVISAYASKTGASQKVALKELEKRAEFLKVIYEGCKSPGEMIEKTQGYGW